MRDRYIIQFIDDYLEKTGKAFTNPVEANALLEKAGILKDCSSRPGKPLRDILRNGELPHAYQPSGKGSGWIIPISKKATNRFPEKSSPGNLKKNFKNEGFDNNWKKGSTLSAFQKNQFDPGIHSASFLPNQPGNYIICLRTTAHLPEAPIKPEFRKFDQLNVLYTGVAGKSLRSRDYRQHFTGNNSGRSTLRKSLGVLFDYKQVPRDNDPTTGKTKFGAEDEKTLSDWMKENLIMYFLPNYNYKNVEASLIEMLNPPLNIQLNKNLVNVEFRKYLSDLRRKKFLK